MARTLRHLPLLLFLALPTFLQAQAERFFRPTEGFTQAKDLHGDFTAVARSIQLEINDVFEGSTAHTEGEEMAFAIGNKLHIETRAGTLRRRLLFREGDSLTRDLVVEAEKALRAEEFLADAIIEVKRWEDGTAHVKVTTWDQWTTTLAFTPSFVGGDFYYLAGVVESNLLGTGQRLGFFHSDGRERDMTSLDYNNNALTPLRLRLGAQLAWLSDGYSTYLSLSKPLESRAARGAFAVSLSSSELSDYVYFDANRLDDLPDSLAERLAGGPILIREFDRLVSHEASVSVTRAYGRRTKLTVSPTADWKETYDHGVTYRYNSALYALAPPDSSALRPEERYDLLGGVSLSLYQYDYKTVHNYRNLKWGETLQTGWRLTTKVARNLEGLGARNDDWYLSHAAVFNNAWWSRLFLVTNAGLSYFVSPEGDFDNGYGSLFGEAQWKPVPALSTSLTATYGAHFAAEKVHQLLLGEDSGLRGFPNAYFAGQSLLLLEAEQRWFPGFEFGTLVPAFAVFGNAGNTFSAWDALDWEDLHYSLGLGLRLGFSKTVQKIVWHLNLSQPLGEERLEGPRFSFLVKKNL